MDFLTILQWILATQAGEIVLGVIVTVVGTATALQLSAVGLRWLARLTPFAWDDSAVDKVLIVADRIAEAARAVFVLDKKMFRRIGQALKPKED